MGRRGTAAARDRKKEREGFERQMTEAWPEITQLVERLLAWPGKATDVEDVVQDVFLSAWRNRAQFKGGAEWSTWVHSIAIRRARSAGRARSSRGRWFGRLLGNAELDLVSKGPAESHAEAPRSDADCAGPGPLRAALARLPHTDREVLVLRYLEELEVEDVADQLNLTRPAVDARLSRARKRLAALMGPGALSPHGPKPRPQPKADQGRTAP